MMKSPKKKKKPDCLARLGTDFKRKKERIEKRRRKRRKRRKKKKTWTNGHKWLSSAAAAEAEAKWYMDTQTVRGYLDIGTTP